MEKLEDDIGDSVRPKNKFESQGESIQETWAVKKAHEKKLDVA